MLVTRKIWVSGNVQGVGFRAFAKDIALRLSLSGYAKNHLDGQVEILLMGSIVSIDCAIAQLQIGPVGANVKKLSAFADPEQPQHAQQFMIY